MENISEISGYSENNSTEYKFELIEMINKLNTDWKELLLNDNNLNILENINNFLNNEIKQYSGVERIFPPQQYIFNAFNLFDINSLKICIVGQDCYHKYNQANGLCFSVNKGIKIPPSLKNIFKELKDDIDFEIPSHGDLTKLAIQGILMLNASLTVRESKAGSHLKYWEKYTDNIISQISDQCENIIFLLWGNFARNKKNLINTDKHFILEAVHPSPLARGAFFGNKHFSKSNDLLKSIGKDEIDWQI